MDEDFLPAIITLTIFALTFASAYFHDRSRIDRHRRLNQAKADIDSSLAPSRYNHQR